VEREIVAPSAHARYGGEGGARQAAPNGAIIVPIPDRPPTSLFSTSASIP